MPSMPRALKGLEGKATKIAYKILGEPANLRFRRNAKQKAIDMKIFAESTTRVR